MTPAARLQAASEILDEVIASARDDGPPADSIVTRYFKQRRYAGSKDRRAVRELVFRAVRRSGDRPETGRAAILGLTEEEPELLSLFGELRGPAPVEEGEPRAAALLVPGWSARPSIFAPTSRGRREKRCSMSFRPQPRRRSAHGGFAFRPIAASTIIRP